MSQQSRSRWMRTVRVRNGCIRHGCTSTPVRQSGLLGAIRCAPISWQRCFVRSALSHVIQLATAHQTSFSECTLRSSRASTASNAGIGSLANPSVVWFEAKLCAAPCGKAKPERVALQTLRREAIWALSSFQGGQQL